jgi:GT2 family glycosyltransferase
MTALTVLVCVKDDWRVVRLLDSLEHQTADRTRYRAIVVRSGREDYGSVPTRFGFNVVVLDSPRPGLPMARNRGLECVETDLVLTTDADCVAAPDLVEQVLAAFAAAGPEVVGIGGAIAKYAHDTATRRHGITINDGQSRLQYLPASPLPYITGAHAAFRTEALRAVGGYDERYSCGEDVDVCYRLGIAGGLLEVNPQMIVFHEDRATAYAHFQRFRWYAADQALLYRLYRGDSRRRPYVNPYPWRRIADALGELWLGLSGLARGDLSGAAAAGITLTEAAGVLAGDIEGSVRHRVLYL